MIVRIEEGRISRIRLASRRAPTCARNRIAVRARMGEQSGMESPHRYPVVFNPKAHSQKGGRVLRFLMQHANHFTVHATHHAGEAREMAARFAA
ncbi:MAG: hypothetical protein NTV46_11030, partial [Verrucomicrobia bacterium]|nr:hypothetical protein [Verrucomicrobiota bacterium]